MSASIRWEGLDELRAALRSLPDDLATEAEGIVLGEAQAAHDEILASYTERTGNLKAGMFLFKSAVSRYGVGVVVMNRAKHSHLFEYGTQVRHTAAGAHRGVMPAAPAGLRFVPKIIRHRARMYDRLKALLVSHGLLVSGDAG